MQRVLRPLVPTLVILLALPGIAAAAGPEARAGGAVTAPTLDPGAVQRLVDLSGGQAHVRINNATGTARFVRIQPGSLNLNVADKATPAQRAVAFLEEHGRVFGIARVDRDLEQAGSFRDGLGSEHVIFAQNYRGVPVFGGQLRAHFNPKGDLVAVNGSFVPRIKLDTKPTVSPEQAAGTAVGVVTKQRGDQRELDHQLGNAAQIVAVNSELVVFRTGLVQGIVGNNHLAYRIEVANDALTVREFVFVDAHTGSVLDQITGIHHALDREVSEASLANVVWDESNGDPTTIPAGWAGGTAQQVTDWQNELDGAGETYNLFGTLSSGTYLSYDGASATMRTVNNDPGIFCPNANWNGVSTNYCSDVTGDDTVAHEWAHAYTEYTNNLIYQWQSGALNESYSDIWGEVVDFLNGRGTDAPLGLRSAGGCSVFGTGAPSVDNTYRWLSGEDDPAFGGAIRDMWNPNCYGDPGKVTDTAQYICSTFDSGGVHINSGIPNHAFALMVDGGTYNGFTITGLGLTKSAHIHWAAQNLLTLTSNFVEHADALDVACSNLTGVNLPALSTSTTSAGLSGEIITPADCVEVAEISDAVEFRTEPTFCNFTSLLTPNAPPLCDGVGTITTVFSEDWETGSIPAGWTAGSYGVANPGTFDNPGWSVSGSLPLGASSSNAAFVPDLNVGDCVADDESGALSLESPAIVLPAAAVPNVAFDHWVATEDGWDGGNLKISVNGGAYTVVPGSAYTFNAYNSTLNAPPGNTNPMASEDTFSGTDGGSTSGSWGQSQINLIGVAAPGDTVRLRFDFGVDGCGGLIGWYVDDVTVYTCSGETPPVCGDGVLDPGETCDDGNGDSGDGCSSTCQVESGWNCSDPVPPASGANVVNDGSFEAGAFGGTWTEFSATFGTPVCDVGTCGTGTGTGPSDGAFWTWFGGIAAAEQGSMTQSVTIPATATDLTFDLEQIVCDSAADFMEVTIDGTQVFLTDGTSPLCGTLGYSSQSVDITAFADGGLHTLEFNSEIFGTNGAGSNFFVDNVVISDNAATSGSPSVCQEVATAVACNGGQVEFDGGIPAEWTVVDDEGLGVVWTTIAGAGEADNYTGGTGEAATVSSDAFGAAEFDTSLITNSFSLANSATAEISYLVNYQNFAALDFLDVDVSIDGGVTWNNLLSWNEDHGGFRSAPGEAVTLDLSAYLDESDVRVRWRYYDPNTGDFDWYAQVDDVSLSCTLTAPRILKQEASAVLSGLLPTGTSQSDTRINTAISRIGMSLWPALWVDDSHLDYLNGRYVFDEEKKAAIQLMVMLADPGNGLSAGDVAAVEAVLAKLVLADLQLAQIALDEALAAADSVGCDLANPVPGPCNCDKAALAISRAMIQMQNATIDNDAGRYGDAIDHYRRAWGYVRPKTASPSC